MRRYLAGGLFIGCLIATTARGQNTFPSTGPVGIGTSMPSQLLEVSGSSAPTVQVTSTGTQNGTDYAILQLKTASSTWQFGAAGPNSSAWAGAAYWYNAANQKMPLILTSNNNLGLGGNITNTNLSGSAMVINGLNVGIGTTSPGAKLEVNGNVTLTSGSGASLTFPDGTKQTTAWTGVVCGGDYAESVDVTGDRKSFLAGDVLVVDPNAPGKFLKSGEPYSTAVTGIYSTKPGTVGRRQKTPYSPDEVPMAMMGIVPVKAIAENGAIRPGDLLVTSSKVGYAMKGTDRSRMLGAVIGKALGKLDSGTGVIEVVVTLQ